MATPQSPEQMMAAVDGIASKRMGVDPQQVAPAPQGAPQGEAPKAAPKADSTQDKAAEQGSPQTEGDKMSADAIVYQVDFGEGQGQRDLTPQQIKSTFDRYSSMNYKNAQYKPVYDLVDQIMRDNPNLNSKQVADQMNNIYKAQTSNPTMGNTEGKQSGDMKADPSDLDSSLQKWEQENAASLPPGYKEMIQGGQQGMQQMQQELARTQAMIRQMAAQNQGVADAAKAQVQNSTGQQVETVRRQIANNLDRVQQGLQLPAEKAQDFMVFAAERGYTLEDFADPQLTANVMSDFKNNMDSPEMERMRGIAQRRQAFTGSLGSTPGGGSNEASPVGDSTFDKFTQAAMAKKGM
tara:strand:+ start:20954 stop:22006 length:1053 start_codon:yes stop_codon:yes gene_type:complete